jgi:hypothetical protein
MWKNFVELDRPQIIIRCMRNACWISKATSTLSEYEIPTVFPLKQCLHERSSVLRCTHTACLAVYYLRKRLKHVNKGLLSMLFLRKYVLRNTAKYSDNIRLFFTHHLPLKIGHKQRSYWHVYWKQPRNRTNITFSYHHCPVNSTVAFLRTTAVTVTG